jgi:hypothetical protein
MNEYLNYVKTEKDAKFCDKIPYFCGEVIKDFKYLIDEFKFEKAKIKFITREYHITFRRKNILINLIYEMGSLPIISIVYRNIKTDVFDENINLNELLNIDNYKIHKMFIEINNSEYLGVDNYIKTIGKLWYENKDEIIKEIKTSIFDLSIILKNNMNIILNRSKV